MHLLWWGNIEPYFIQTYKADEFFKKHVTIDLQPPNTLEQLDEIGEMKKRFTYDLIDLKKLSSDVKHTIEVDNNKNFKPKNRTCVCDFLFGSFGWFSVLPLGKDRTPSRKNAIENASFNIFSVDGIPV